MTGFGQSEFETPNGPVQIEFKTTNHRYFDFSTRLPYPLLSYEEKIRKTIQQKIRRGKIHLAVTAPEILMRKAKLHVDEPLAKEYAKALRRLNQALGLGEKVTLAQIVRMPDVITRSVAMGDRDKLWKNMERALLRALKALDASRRAEGEALKKDLLSRAAKIEACLKKTKAHLPKHPKPNGNSKTNDFTEEVVRMQTHVKSFGKTLRSGREIGRKIDFIAQEMMRETNTIGAKCNDVVIAGYVIEVKSELEKIREQAQNLE